MYRNITTVLSSCCAKLQAKLIRAPKTSHELELPTVSVTWHASKHKVGYKLQHSCSLYRYESDGSTILLQSVLPNHSSYTLTSWFLDVPLMELCTLSLFTRMPGKSYRRRLRSLLSYSCYVFRALINSLVCWSWCR